MNPTQLRYIYNKYSGEYDQKYKTWTQVEKLVEWPPCKSAVFFYWRETNTFIVGANYDDETRIPLQEWRVKYSMNRVNINTNYNDPKVKNKTNPMYEAWREMYYEKNMRQTEIAKILGISISYCSMIKRKYDLGALEVE